MTFLQIISALFWGQWRETSLWRETAFRLAVRQIQMCTCICVNAWFNVLLISCGGTTVNTGKLPKKERQKESHSLTVATAVAILSLHLSELSRVCVAATGGGRPKSYWRRFLSISEMKWSSTHTGDCVKRVRVPLLVLSEGFGGFSRKLPVELQYGKRLLWISCLIMAKKNTLPPTALRSHPSISQLGIRMQCRVGDKTTFSHRDWKWHAITIKCEV